MYIRRSHRRCASLRREGKVLALVAVLLPALFGMAGLLVDGAILLSTSRVCQHVVDSAATAAALELQEGGSIAEAAARATDYVRNHHGLTDADVQVISPPISGEHIGSDRHVEVLVRKPVRSHFVHLSGGQLSNNIGARAVAGYENATAPTAIHVLDPQPAPFTIAPIATIPILPALPSLVGGLEILGVGKVKVNGCIVVNTRWGGVDEDGRRAGINHGPPFGVACMPVLPLSALAATDIRVAGGVDNPKHYKRLTSASSKPFHANRRPVRDPLEDLPVPMVSVDPNNVKANLRDSPTVAQLTLSTLLGPITLRPGVYNSLVIPLGRVRFEPGVYIIRGALLITALGALDEVRAEGVMFYVTDNLQYSPNGIPADHWDGTARPSVGTVPALLPSVVLKTGLLNGKFSGLDDPSSPYHGLFLFQRRADPRLIAIVQESLLTPADLAGIFYAKWGHIILVAQGPCSASFVSGTMRILTVLDSEISPKHPLPPARDVYLVE